MKKNQKQAIAVGAGLAGLAAAAAGVYMFTGKNAKNRKKVSKWVGDMQNEVVQELNKAGKVTKSTYNKIVDTAARNYKGLKNVSVSELAMVAAELKSSWDTISEELQSATNNVRRVAPKTVRTVAGKVIAQKAARNASKKKAAKTAPAKKAPAKKAAPKKAAKKR